jgi:carbon storage regulator
MLVLSRRSHEGIILPGLGVTVRLLTIKGNTVRIGIEAPDGVKVLREELRHRALTVPVPETAQLQRA